jgi:SulP family sulfate permease
VISGFITAAAIIIGFSQVKHLFGLKIPQTESFLMTLNYLGQQLSNTNGITLVLGVVCLLSLFYFKKGLGEQLKKRGVNPVAIALIGKIGPLIVVIISSLVVWGLQLDRVAAVKVVGNIPQGLPPLTLPLLILLNP